MTVSSDPRRRLPSVDQVVTAALEQETFQPFGRERIVEAGRAVLEQLRQDASLAASIRNVEDVLDRVIEILNSEEQAGIRPVVNATGIVLHTNLGRAVLPGQARQAMARLEGCCSLQIELDTGKRGRRDKVVERLLQKITGAQAATVVNNNAAATLLVLAALGAGKEVIVSRGQLIEIGGSFRLPDVIAQSGARMVEVGTTNKTHLRDYENALTDETAILLRVNPSNYRVIGFSKQVPTEDLVALKKNRAGQGRDLIVIDDLGCGALVDLSRCGLPREHTVQESLKAGADVALFSADKLIGGPQGGIIVGREECLAKIRKHPLARALRVGKYTIAALEATLKLFLDPDTVWKKNPTLRMLAVPLAELEQKASALCERLKPFIACRVEPGQSACGGGSLPDATLETRVVAIEDNRFSAEQWAKKLRLGEPSVVSRVRDGKVLLDVRTLLDGDEERIEQAVKKMVEQG